MPRPLFIILRKALACYMNIIGFLPHREALTAMIQYKAKFMINRVFKRSSYYVMSRC